MMVGCSTSPRTPTEIPVTKSEQPDYLVRERYPNPAPTWASDFATFRQKNDGKGYFYFLGESGAVSDRIAGCDLASLEAKKKIAQQIATLISDQIATTRAGQLVIDKDNPDDPGMRKHFESTVASKSMALISGVKEFGQYWEERDYSAGGGKKRVYECQSVVAISGDDMKTALRRAAGQTPQVIEDAEAKSVVKEALKDIDSQFRSYRSTPQ